MPAQASACGLGQLKHNNEQPGTKRAKLRNESTMHVLTLLIYTNEPTGNATQGYEVNVIYIWFAQSEQGMDYVQFQIHQLQILSEFY
jgi:hypothetical protein